MGRPRKTWQNDNAAHARASKSAKKTTYSSPLPNPAVLHDAEYDSDIEIVGYTSAHESLEEIHKNEVTKWTGGVNHILETDNSDFSWEETSSEEESDLDSDEPQSDAEDKEEMIERLRRSMEHEDNLIKCVITVMVEDKLMIKRTEKDWKRAESNRSLGYNGHSGRTQRHNNKKARDKEVIDAELRKS
jgi:hypothetical protein